ncbi:MAG: sulfotransferase [Phycisphaerales bacterium JB047]
MSTRSGHSDQELKRLAQHAQALEIAGRYVELIEVGKQMSRARPEWSLGHFFLGSGQCGNGMLDEADRSLRKAISRDDKQAGYFVRHGEVLNRLGHREEATVCASRAVELDPDNPDVLVPAAMVIWLGGDARGAHDLLDDAIARGAVSPKLRSVHALVCAEVGRLDDGIESLRALLDEHDGGRDLPRLLHSECCMYLAKLLDKAERYDEAFEQARIGGSLRETKYDPHRAAQKCDDRLAAWSKDRFDAIPTSRVKSDAPVFIIGMPRSGTSLVEQIIASHPLAYGCGELLDAWHAGFELSEPDALVTDPVAKVDQLKPAALDRCARRVLKVMERAASREKGKGVQRITDKLPNNFELVGIIHKMLPNARFIHCVRNPLDVCISCFLLDFVGDHNHGYSYNLEHLAHQYQVYQRYMAHWRSIESIPMLEVRYEELIGDAEGGARGIIEFLGLDWDDACARSHETKRAVSTLSSDQVRKPMYTSSKERWRNYERHIGVLIEALGTGDR